MNEPLSGHCEESATPIAVGGIGGSGTRLVARILSECGIRMCGHTNRADDCLHFAFLFGQPEVQTIDDHEFANRFQLLEHAILGLGLPPTAPDVIDHLLAGEETLDHHRRSMEWRRLRAAALYSSARQTNEALQSNCWGWKAPSTHAVLHRLTDLRGDLKYVHVVRNGIDMAFSNNSRQLRVWGRPLFDLDGTDTSASNMLRNWVLANERALEIGKRMGSQFYWLDYDALIAKPDCQLPKLFDFVRLKVGEEQQKAMTALIHTPSSAGRAREKDLSSLNQEDVKAVGRMGFDTYGA